MLVAGVAQEVHDAVAEDADGGHDGLLQRFVVSVEVDACKRKEQLGVVSWGTHKRCL